MEIRIAKTAGFCFGVNEAVKKAFELAETKKNNIFTFGPLIHNKEVIRSLEEKGVSVIESTEDDRINGATVLIRAHGITPETQQTLNDLNCEVVDATCPFVKKIHNLVKEEYDKGRSIIIIGDPNHPEVIGINGYCNNEGLIIESEEQAKELCERLPKDSEISVVEQTTFSINKYAIIHDIIDNSIDKPVFFDTICNATVKRQKEAEELASEVDIMIIVGGKNSSNTLKLYDLCRSLCSRTFLVESASDLDRKWFKNNFIVGVTAGASTPGWSIEEVIKLMSDINLNENEAKESDFAAMLEDSLTTIKSGEVVKGAVNKIDDKGVYVDLGFKYEGFISVDEFRPAPGVAAELPKIGDEVEAKVVRVNDKDCEVILSKRRIEYSKNMQMIEDSFNNKTPITVRVTEAIKGGLIAFAGGIRIFIPASQVEMRFVRDLTKFVGQDFDVVITDYEKGPKGRTKIVGSRKVLVEAAWNEKEDAFWGDIYEGKVTKGIVKSFTNFGAFVDINGCDGLIHITELSWNKIRNPQEVLSIGQEVEVKILSFDREKRKISLGYRKEEDNPWKDAETTFQVGDILKVKVVRFTKFGVFVNIADGIDGLVHISQISNRRVKAASDCLELGQEVEAKIIETNIPEHKINLSIREVKAYDPPYAEEETEKPKKERKPKKEKKPEEETFQQDIVSSGSSIADILKSAGAEIPSAEDKE